MKIIKKLLFVTIAFAAIVSCTEDSFVGEQSQREANGTEGAISFSSSFLAVTRSSVGAKAAALLNNNFVVEGTKTKDNSVSEVFDNYNVNFVENTAATTTSNTADWDYVGQSPHSNSSGTLPIQTIKHWDYAASQYDFAAYSLGVGTGSTPTFAIASAIADKSKTYTLQGSADELKSCYISDLVTAYHRDDINDYGKTVQISFRSLAAKIRLAFYETVPGYSIKDVKFYTASAPTALATDGTESDPTLFASDAVIPSGEGTMTITFPTTGFTKRSNSDYNKAHVSFTKKSDSDLSSTLVLEDLADFAAAEKKEANGNYLGRTSNTATFAGGLVNSAGKYHTILPYETGTNLTLRIKYTLVSTDISKETIDIDNATAVIPAELAKWCPNYAYTYIFKIGDTTNGSTGVDGSGNVITGLTPITLDAVVVDSEDGIQETITTVSTPSITTYMAGEVITANDEYITDEDIYVIVNNGTSNVALTVGTNAKLFTATVESGAIQNISEASVDNAFVNGTYNSTAKTYTVTDAAGKNLVLTDTESTLLSAITSIADTDSPTGNAITVNGAKFKPTAAGTYVFQYVKTAPVAATPGEYQYKVIKVKD